MRQLHKATALSLITASLVAAAAVLTPTLAKAEPPTVLSGADQISEPRADHPDHVSQPPTDDPLLESDTATPPASRQWRSPVGGLDLLTDFDPPPQRWLPGHRGVDLAASADLPVTAAGAGTVVFAEDLAGRGVISIVHANGLRTTYEPVEPLVAAGDAVTAGQTIGHLQPGHASCPNAACLHLGLKRGPLYLDPMLLFGSGKVRLLPRPGRAGQSAELNSERSIAAPAMTRGRAVHRTPQPNRSTAKPDDAIRTAPRAASRLPTGISIVHRSEARP
jgi:murein DD-endopeptidase MepM/ murein hydrolase activator NlpD